MIHTKVPTTNLLKMRSVEDFKHYSFYRHAVTTLHNEPCFKLDEISVYGAHVLDKNGNRLTKKKIRWGDLDYLFFSGSSFDVNKALVAELKKHGLIVNKQI